MASVIGQTARQKKLDEAHQTTDVRRWVDSAWHLSLLLCLGVVVWHLFASEAQKPLEQRIRVVLVGLSISLSVAFWIAGLSWPRTVKWISVGTCLLAVLSAGLVSVQNFDQGGQILKPAYIHEGRVIHEGLGLSFLAPPGFQPMLQPQISHGIPGESPMKGRLPERLRYGEFAILDRFLESPPPPLETGRGPAWIILEVQKDRVGNTNNFIREVRTMESKWAAMPDIKIVRHTHCSTFAGLEMIEFEFMKESKQMRARQVYLKWGPCVLNFTFSTESEADRQKFDDFLNSIQAIRHR